MTSKDLMEKAKALEPQIRIGKNGLTANALEEIKSQLKKKKIIKIKILKSALDLKDKKEIVKDLQQMTESKVILQVGFVVVLSK